MPNASFRLTVLLAAPPEQVYRAWLDPVQHGAFTGSPADNDGQVGGHHRAWGGYITGTNVALEPGRRIVQSWRTSEFPPDAVDSRLQLRFTPVDGGTELVLEHSDLPEDQARGYEQGWVEHYFEPMKRHFARMERPLSMSRLAPAPLAALKPVAKSAVKAKSPPRKKRPVKKVAGKKSGAKRSVGKKKKPAAAHKPAKRAAGSKSAKRR